MKFGKEEKKEIKEEVKVVASEPILKKTSLIENEGKIIDSQTIKE